MGLQSGKYVSSDYIMNTSELKACAVSQHPSFTPEAMSNLLNNNQDKKEPLFLRRQWARAKTTLSCYVHQQDLDKAHCLSLSAGGLKLESQNPFYEKNSLLFLALYLYGVETKPINLKGMVKNRIPIPDNTQISHYIVTFTQIDRIVMDALNTWVISQPQFQPADTDKFS